MSSSSASSARGTESAGRLSASDYGHFGSGAHQFSEGTAYFGMGTSKSELVDHVENGSFTTNETIGGKILGFDVVGNISSPNYPSNGNVLASHAIITKTSDGKFNLLSPRPSGTLIDKTFTTEAAAMKSGRNALKKFIDKNYSRR